MINEKQKEMYGQIIYNLPAIVFHKCIKSIQKQSLLDAFF